MSIAINSSKMTATKSVHGCNVERLRLSATAIPTALERNVFQVGDKALSGSGLVCKADTAVSACGTVLVSHSFFIVVFHGGVIGMKEYILLSLVDDFHGFENDCGRLDDSSEGQAVHSDTTAFFVEEGGTSADEISYGDVVGII